MAVEAAGFQEEVAALTVSTESSTQHAARIEVRELLSGLDSDTVEAALLIVSELASMVELATGATGAAVSVKRGRALVRIEMTVPDGAPDPSQAIVWSTQKGSGMGLQVIDAVADRWGMDPGPPETVWCELEV